jgi:hypothetical protein
VRDTWRSLKNPNDPIHEFLRTHKVPGAEAADGDAPEDFYNGLDGAVR